MDTDSLPDEIWTCGIFPHLPAVPLLRRCAVVCRRWHRLVADEALWERMVHKLPDAVAGPISRRGTWFQTFRYLNGARCRSRLHRRDRAGSRKR